MGSNPRRRLPIRSEALTQTPLDTRRGLLYGRDMTTTLSDIFDPEAFYTLIDQGYIRVRSHDQNPDLRIADYDSKTQFERKWTPETLASRGLIFRESTGEVVSRGFPKFFNWDDASQAYPRVGPVLLSTKYDGSLGILYQIGGIALGIATRGSFHSEQAEHATKRLLSYMEDGIGYYGQLMWLLNNGFTPLFEIIYPTNRIVVDYGSADSLVLLDIIENKTGKSRLDLFDDFNWPEKADKISLKGGFTDALPSTIPDDEEGFVLYWPESNFRCKVKGATYVHLHSILTETSSRDLWRNMAVHAYKGYVEKPSDWGALGVDPAKARVILEGHEDWLPALLDGVPDEFYSWVRLTIASIKDDVDSYVTKATRIARELLQEPDSQARWHLSQTHGEIGGAALSYANYGNEKRLLLSAWKNAFPAFEKPFANVEE